jgi:hypothetical protein
LLMARLVRTDARTALCECSERRRLSAHAADDLTKPHERTLGDLTTDRERKRRRSERENDSLNREHCECAGGGDGQKDLLVKGIERKVGTRRLREGRDVNKASGETRR